MNNGKKIKIIPIINSKIFLFFVFYSHFFSIPLLYGDMVYKKKSEKIFFRKNKENPYYNKKNYFQIIKNKFLLKKKMDFLIEKAKNYRSTPYRYGGNTKDGIDCSAFIKNIFASYKILLPRRSFNQAKKGFLVPKKYIEKGDLLFFATGKYRKKINHVGMVIHVNHNNIFFIHASTSGVLISRLYQKYWKNKFITARRILYSS
ncbi:C40 family peptidase [Blattabacterium punctulatus]|uniref:C40 family peptidase n=1 Tax=Blattabacterium punctulatus TaxID=164514 RepID=UPI001F1731DF|nr:C40 family peptidase [Blattabacterium punctulatus]